MAQCAARLGKKVALLKRVGLLGRQEPDVLVRRAASAGELEAAYRLVHDMFLEKGYIDPYPGGLRVRVFEALPEMATFVATRGSEAVGVMSFVEDSPDLGLPSDVCFRSALQTLRDARRFVGEITNLAIRPDHRNTAAFLELARAVFAHATSVGCDDMVIAVSPGHVPFFRDVLQADPWVGRRCYSHSKEDIVEGMRWDLRVSRDRVIRADRELGEDAFLEGFFYVGNPFRDQVASWTAQARVAFLRPALLRTLFVERSALLSRCSPEQLDALGLRWGRAGAHLLTSEIVKREARASEVQASAIPAPVMQAAQDRLVPA